MSHEVSLMDALRMRAVAVRGNAYVPYSRFPVGAALLTPGGEIYEGCNVENGSFPLSLCAERGAVAAAVAHGDREFEAVFIVGDRVQAMPCGGCRQVLSEFGDMHVYVSYGDGRSVNHYWLHELLPESFHFESPIQDDCGPEK
ncbi:MAG: cytidine deaminase [Firmicutes bacterium]|nr:cytidine deaminase [Bacillota bacterium]MCL5013655.1 cytidine deaminase [Bacillota bacterium]